MLAWMSPREYRLVVDGELSDQLGLAFTGMTLTRDHGTTVLVGRVRDQAELQGVLRRVSDLGLTLLSAEALEGDDALESMPAAPPRSHG
jgi:hypothetical protein